MRIRTPIQVTQRALILGTLSARASCEVTEGTRAARIADGLLPWLENTGAGEAIDPIERDLLNTPHGRLGPSLRMDANAAGEAAAVLCWTLEILEKPPIFAWADQAQVIKVLSIGRPEANDLLKSPELRARAELAEFCKQVRLMLVLLRERRAQEKGLDEAACAKLEAFGRKRVTQGLAAAGLELGESDWEAAKRILAEAGREQRNAMAGAYFVRDHAIDWLLDSRATYFESSPETP